MSPSPDPTDQAVLYYVAGAPWDSAFVAAIIAGSIAFATLLWTIGAHFLTRHRLSAFETRSLDQAKDLANQQKVQADRAQHHQELTDGVAFAVGRSKQSQAAGITMLEQLKGASWATDDDRLKVAAVMDAIGEA